MLSVRVFNRLIKGHEDRCIYTVEEAIEHGIQYKPWIECDTTGDWGLSDDGYVSELLYRQYYGGHKEYGYWSFTGGIVKRYKNDYGKNKEYETLLIGPLLTGERKAKKIADALKTDKAKKIMRAYLLHDRKIDVAIHSVLPAAPMIELNKWRTVAKSEAFKKMVKQEILEIMEGMGFNRQRALLLLDEAIEMAREKKDVTNMMRATETLFDILGFNDKDIKKDSLEFTSKSLEHLADSVLEHKDTIKLARETPLNEYGG